MKSRILAITLFLIGTIVACKKVEQKLSNQTYTDAELKIDKNTAFANEERKIKEGIMGFSALSKVDRKAIVDGIIMDNKFAARIENHTMPIFKKLNKKEIISLYKIMIPNKAFKIIDNDQTIVEFNPTPQWAPCDYYISYWNRRYVTYTIDNCVAYGSNQCFRYVPCDN